MKCFPGESYNGRHVHKHNKYVTLNSTAHRALEDMKAMEAVFSCDSIKAVLSKLTVQSHAQIVAYWQEKSKEWLGMHQFVTHMGRDYTRTMAIHLNKWDLQYDKLQDIFHSSKSDEASFNDHLIEAGVTRAWCNKLWFNFSKSL